MPFIGMFKLLHVMLTLLFLAFASAVRNIHQMNASHLTGTPFATAKYEIMFLSKRWRSERNLWLAAFALTMWAVLYAFYRELGRRLQLEERLVEFEMSGYTMTADDDTTREPSVSREVTSKPNILSPRSITTSPMKSARKVTPQLAEQGGDGGSKPPRAPTQQQQQQQQQQQSRPSPPVVAEVELVGETFEVKKDK